MKRPSNPNVAEFHLDDSPFAPQSTKHPEPVALHDLPNPEYALTPNGQIVRKECQHWVKSPKDTDCRHGCAKKDT